MDTKDLKNKIKTILSEFLGVEATDVNDDDNFIEDLRMEPTSLFDFQEKLNKSGIDTAKLDFNAIHDIDDLVDALDGADIDHSSHESEQ